MSSTNRNRVAIRWMLGCLAVTSGLPQLFADEQGNRGYYRFPAVHDDTIVFVAEGDLWTVSLEGGNARRLTSHAGDELRPCLSPDGKTVAFAATYEGPTEVYTMPLDGGRPKRHTVEAESSQPVTWTPAGKLVYATQHFSTLPTTQLVAIDLETNGRRRIPLSQASDAAFAADGTIYFVRPRFHRQQVKRYQGGTARNIWKFREGDDEATLLTEEIAGEAHSPMWFDGRIYFITDTDGTMNIWSMDTEGRELRQHTEHSGWDVKSASLHHGRIVYRVGADLWKLDIDTGVQQRISIRLTSDLDQLRDKWVKDPLKQLSSAHLHPKGESVALVARGRLFVAPVGKGRLVRASREPGVRYRDAVFLPDGKRILTLSDESGEIEFWSLAARGLGPARQLTTDGAILKWRGYPSPDSKRIAYSDKNYDLWIVDVESGRPTLVSKNREGIRGIAWSPDSRWLVYGQVAFNTYTQLLLYNIEQQTTTELTSDRVNSLSPAWSHDGRWLYFLSDRGLLSVTAGPWGPRQPEPYFDEPMKLYRLAMRRGVRSPFQPPDELHVRQQQAKEAKTNVPSPRRGEGGRRPDEGGSQSEKLAHGAKTLTISSTKESPADKPAATDEDADGEQGSAAEDTPLQIDLDGIARRVKPLPVPRGNFRSLAAGEKALFWLDRDGDGTHLMSLPIGNKTSKLTKVAAGVGMYELSADRQKLLIRKGTRLYVVDAKASQAKLEDHRVDLSSWSFVLNVREDWRQIFVDAWRLHRDYFYDPAMHGVNWSRVRQKYEPLVDRVTTRSELSDLIGQMVAELSTLHTSVRGGDLREGADDVSVPTLGARLVRDENAGGYRIDYIYQSDPDYPSELSPLSDPDLEVQHGDLIEAINGQPVLSTIDPHLLLREQEGKQVLLQLKDVDAEESREVIVIPTDDEAALRYRDWEYTRRQHVERAGEGKLGYVHLQAMGRNNLTEWYRNFYPVFNRQGLIIDVRHNRGGNIDSIILEKLLRKAWFYWQGRVGKPYWNMQYAFRGHLVVLCNEYTASDGEAFAEGFRRLGLGQVIGTRTWGGEIWLTSSNRLSDGGIATAAEFGVYGPERKWLIEGHGVEPDVVVDNLPHATFRGQDAQLDAAIEHLQALIAQDPRDIPEPPVYPDKSFDYP